MIRRGRPAAFGVIVSRVPVASQARSTAADGSTWIEAATLVWSIGALNEIETGASSRYRGDRRGERGVRQRHDRGRAASPRSAGVRARRLRWRAGSRHRARSRCAPRSSGAAGRGRRTGRGRGRPAAQRRAFAIDSLLAWFAGGRRSTGLSDRRVSTGGPRQPSTGSLPPGNLSRSAGSRCGGSAGRPPASRPAGRYRP